MNGNGARPIPLLGDVSLEFVQQIAHDLDAGFVSTRIAGLSGELQQRAGRSSHRIRIAGVLFGEDSAAQLETLQAAAEAGDELPFASDITSALDLQRVIIKEFRAVETAGRPHRFSYELALVESPPLPPPAQVEPFGGLDDFGLGDLGFDTDLLGELTELAGDIAGAVDDALGVIEQLGALANLDGLSLGGLLDPLSKPVSGVAAIGASLRDSTRALAEVFS